MPKKRLEFAARALRDIEAIEAYYLEVASELVADQAVDAILTQAEKIAALDLKFRPGSFQYFWLLIGSNFSYEVVSSFDITNCPSIAL